MLAPNIGLARLVFEEKKKERARVWQNPSIDLASPISEEKVKRRTGACKFPLKRCMAGLQGLDIFVKILKPYVVCDYRKQKTNR